MSGHLEQHLTEVTNSVRDLIKALANEDEAQAACARVPELDQAADEARQRASQALQTLAQEVAGSS